MNEQKYIEKSNVIVDGSGAEPLVTFALFAYTQEKYIREAVEGALVQTYENLEIIISDDASPDKTFEIMQELVRDYSGPHKIILNRNERNLGIVGHVNKVFEISHGEIIVMAAGDDISMPERAQTIVEVFTSQPPDTMCVYSDAWVTDKHGEKIKKNGRKFVAEYPYNLKSLIESHYPHITGATAAWRRGLMDVFGPINSEVEQEDTVLLHRAILLGRVAYSNKCLVDYRRTETAVSRTLSRTMGLQRHWRWSSTFVRQLHTDVKKHSEHHVGYLAVMKILELDLAKFEFIHKQWQKPGNLFEVIYTAIKLRSRVIFTQYLRARAYHYRSRYRQIN
jgi:glycosyltransferase involved in cell wall biosynthesis